MIKVNRLCFKCGKPIDELNDNFIKLISYYQGDIIEEVWMHLKHDGDCWGKFNDDKVNERILHMSKAGMQMLNEMGMVA